MRIIARNTLIHFWERHPKSRQPLERWHKLAKAASWKTMNDVQSAFRNAKVLNADRVRFEIGDFRLIVAFDFGRGAAYVKFIGTHTEYDRIDALTVSQF